MLLWLSGSEIFSFLFSLENFGIFFPWKSGICGILASIVTPVRNLLSYIPDKYGMKYSEQSLLQCSAHHCLCFGPEFPGQTYWNLPSPPCLRGPPRPESFYIETSPTISGKRDVLLSEFSGFYQWRSKLFPWNFFFQRLARKESCGVVMMYFLTLILTTTPGVRVVGILVKSSHLIMISD